MEPGSAEMGKSQTSPWLWRCSNWKCHHLSIMHECGTLIKCLKKWVYTLSDLLRIIMKSYCCSRPKCIISLFAEYSHILHATDIMICSETIEDIYNLKIECTSESEETVMHRHITSNQYFNAWFCTAVAEEERSGFGAIFVFWGDTNIAELCYELQYIYSLNLSCRVLRVGRIRGFEKTPPVDLRSCIYCMQN